MHFRFKACNPKKMRMEDITTHVRYMLEGLSMFHIKGGTP